jgi:hypothetical protein
MKMSDDDKDWIDDAPPVEPQFVGAPTEGPESELEGAVRAALTAEDPKALRDAMTLSEAQDREIAEGAEFVLRRDPKDPRWDILSIRVPNARYHGPDGVVMDEISLHGERARWRIIRWCTSLVKGAAEALGAPAQFSALCTLLHREARIAESAIDDRDKPIVSH